MSTEKIVVLVVLDGWGLDRPGQGNAVALANTPTFDTLWETCPTTTLAASGQAVGLPDGQMGNSEVGHSNLGAGRVVYQASTRISKAIRERGFFDNAVLLEAMTRARTGRLHLMGLVSDGGVHSQLDHVLALLELAKKQGVSKVYVHAFLDGRDCSPHGGVGFVNTVEQKLHDLAFERGAVATLTGRYWAMDRDKRWSRTELAYRALRSGEGQRVSCSASEAVQRAYGEGQTDEFIKPIVVDASGTIEDGDVVLFFNFRPDRARQLSHALGDEVFSGFERGPRPDVHFVAMTLYESNLDVPVAFPPVTRLKNVLGEVLSDAGLRQFRCAETEKYAHVTYFFNNGREDPFPGEEQQLVPSPQVATYDLQPEMSAHGVGQLVATRVQSGAYAFVLVNFANPDMVGHTGVIAAAVKAVEAADAALGRVLQAVKGVGGGALVLADHGNAEVMLRPDGSPHTAHTTNPVPLVYVGPQALKLRSGGALCDVAPTVLRLLDLPQPAEMDGQCLIQP